MSKEARQKILEEMTTPICAAHGVELVEVRQITGRGGMIIRVTIDRERAATDNREGSGVSLDDCTSVSRDLSSALDVHDVIEGKFHLEVSSPGLDRPLTKPGHFTRFAGREIKVKTFAPVQDRRSFRGVLLGFDDGVVELEAEGSKFQIPFEVIAKANLVVQF